MKKALFIAWKDILIQLADRPALVFLLVTPLILTLILGGAFGGSGSSSGISAIQVAVVNLDKGDFGQALEDVFTSDDLADLLDPELLETEAAGRQMVDEQDYAAAVIIPADFSETLMPMGSQGDMANGLSMLSGGGSELGTTNVIIYANPTRPISSNVVKAVVEGFGWQVSSSLVGGTVSVEQLLASGKLNPAGIISYVQEMSGRLQEQADNESGTSFKQLVNLREESTGGLETGNDTDWVMAYYAPSMAIMFLSFGVAQGARTLLAEERIGTLGRLLTTPTSSNSILGGKLVSTFVLGLLQFSVLVTASSLIFQLNWGHPLAVLLLSLALVAAMTSLGVALAGVVRNENQVNTWGVAILLVFSAISGSFIPRFGFPEWLKILGWITPNAWALDGFTKLGTGGGLGDIGIELLALSILTVVLFTLGTLRLRRRVAV